MATLSAWQRIDRVLPGRPFGDGRDGALTISGNTTQSLNTKSCSGSASSTTLSADTDSSPYAVGDVLFIEQTRGTGVGKYEVNMVASVGSDQYTLTHALQNTYTDSGASQAQVFKIPMYTTVTVDSGISWSAASWNQDTGGHLVWAANVITDGNGSFVLTGANGSRSQPNPGTGAYTPGRGFRGAFGASQPPSYTSYSAEGSTADSAQETSNNGNGAGGGAITGTMSAGGSGGGNGVAGSQGSTSGGATAGTVGATAGAADLTEIVLGGGASGGLCNQTGGVGDGGSGAGIMICFTKDFDLTGGTINANGGNGGGNTNDHGGGGGGGGSVLIVCQTATLGTNLMTATGGTGFTTGTGSDGGNGGAGRIAVHHSSTVSGSSASPSFTDVSDPSMVETTGGVVLFALT